MRNHAEKRRDMARSVLPSTARKSARLNKACGNRAHRRNVTLTLDAWAKEIDPYDFEGHVLEPEHDNRRDPTWDGVVWERRAHDKLSVVRWAERLCETLPELKDACYLERYAFFKKVMPDSLIGRHALSHIKNVLDPDDPWRGSYKDVLRNRKIADEERLVRMIEACSLIIPARGAHKGLNLALKSTHIISHTRYHWVSFNQPKRPEAYTCSACEDPRTLLGTHDIEDFAQDLIAHDGLHPRVDLVLGIAGRIQSH